MRARPTSRHALILCCLFWPALSQADGPEKGQAPPSPGLKPTAIAPTTPPTTSADVNRERNATEARLRELEATPAKDRPAVRPLVELLEARRRKLAEWEKLARDRADAEHPEHSPEAEAAENKADLERSNALLEQSAKTPDLLLPEAFQVQGNGTGAPPTDARLAEMKEAIDAVRVELKDRAAALEALRADGARSQAASVASLRLERDKVHQELAALTSRRVEPALGGALASPEGRDLARERQVNLDWETRVEAERLAAIEARVTLAGRRLELGTFAIQARAARVRLARRLVDRMEERYATLAERQRTALQNAVAKEEKLAARTDDPLVKYQAKRTSELLQLQDQVIAFEKAYATSSGLSVDEQRALADSVVTDFADLRKTIEDGNVSPLDALRLKNDFRRIGPERAQIVRTDLATADAELTTFENALTDAEIDLVNDSRDDRFDREALLEQVPDRRRGEAKAILEELETRHKGLLNRRRVVLQKLASRSEEAHSYVLRRIETLDKQYAYIRTHIFWVRDAEPLGEATLAHARDDSVRTARALFRLAAEAGDRSLWGRVSPAFALTLAALVILPWPLRLGQKALDRLRPAAAPDAALGLADFQPKGGA